MNKPIIKWLVVGALLVGEFYLVQFGLAKLSEWVIHTTPTIKTSQTAPETATEQIIISDGIPKCETEGYKILMGVCDENN